VVAIAWRLYFIYLPFRDFPAQTRPFPKGLNLSRRSEIRSNISKRKKIPANLPPQLQRRVQSGAISQAQAAQTARERQTLKAAFGSDWRTQVFGKGGAKAASGPFASREVSADRAAALAKAQAKLGGAVGSASKARRGLPGAAALFPGAGKGFPRQPMPTPLPFPSKKRKLKY
jgi:hypothetical protein